MNGEQRQSVLIALIISAASIVLGGLLLVGHMHYTDATVKINATSVEIIDAVQESAP